MMFPLKIAARSRCGCQSAGCLCSGARLVRLLGRRYVVLVLSLLANRGTARFGQVRARLRGVSTSTLAAILSDLTRTGLVDRVVISERPPRVNYSLTKEGHEVCRLVRGLFRRKL